MIEIGTAPPLMLGVAVLLVALAWSIRMCGPELREWLQLLRQPGATITAARPTAEREEGHG